MAPTGVIKALVWGRLIQPASVADNADTPKAITIELRIFMEEGLRGGLTRLYNA